jgi:hypothetical protein
MAIAWRDGASIFSEEERLFLTSFGVRALVALNSHYAEGEGVESMGLAVSTTPIRRLVAEAKCQWNVSLLETRKTM